MEYSNIHASVDRQKPIRSNYSTKSSLSGRTGTIRRLNAGSIRAVRRDPKGTPIQRLKSNRVVLCLGLIALWCYIGFHLQSKWAHNDDHGEPQLGNNTFEEKISNAVDEKTVTLETKEKDTDLDKKSIENLAIEKRANNAMSNISNSNPHKKKVTLSDRKSRKVKKAAVQKDPNSEFEDGLIPTRNTSYGLTVGPFAHSEDAVLEWNADKRRGTCDRNGNFARLVFSRSFLLVFHELSMTGAPISMMELASELLSCGAQVSAVVLSRKGGLLPEMQKRGIKVVKDRVEGSFRAAAKAHAVVAGSAVCSTWIEQYLSHHPTKADRILWWIMENRREYFDRSMHLLNRVKTLAFLSESQINRWLSWCEEENIKLTSKPITVPLSVNEELAFAAGISTSLNTPDKFSVERMVEKREILRNEVRREMNLGEDDVLVMSLSSVNPGKGQRWLVEAAVLIDEDKVRLKDKLNFLSSQNQSTVSVEPKNGTLFEGKDVFPVTGKAKMRNLVQDKESNSTTPYQTNNEIFLPNLSKRRRLRGRRHLRGLLANEQDNKVRNFRVLIGSLGSKSNKIPYLRLISRIIMQHSSMSKLIMWTPATTHVVSLYAAADIYVMNAQGIGETFGRVTIEAMAFGLPVLGTDAGGTKEIVQHGVTGLLHPVGRNGTETLAENMLFLIKNPDVRVKMGAKGREVVVNKYLKNSTYNKLALVLAECMRT